MSQSEKNCIEAAIDAGAECVEASKRVTTIEGIPVSLMPSDMKTDILTKVLDAADARAPAPKRRRGTSVHHELVSFILHINRFKDEHSAIFADINAVRLTGVLNYHPIGAASEPRWGDHRSVYTCQLSREWKLWKSQNDVPMSQDAFAEFIDNNMGDLASPKLASGGAISVDVAEPAAVLDMARNLTIRSSGVFGRKVNPTTGEFSMECKSENDSTSTKIPRAFTIGIPVFEGGESYALEARVRFTLRDGKATFAYSLYQHEKVLADAFGAVRAAAAAQTGLVVFTGSPEA